MTVISSRQHPLARQCRAIVRGDDPRVLLDGWHLLADALAARVVLHAVAVRQDEVAAHQAELAEVSARGVPVMEVTSAVMESLSPVRASSGVVAIGDRLTWTPQQLDQPPPALVVAALGLQDPGNVGSLVRSADAGGATGVLLDVASADPWSWKALRASMGSVLRLPVHRSATALDDLRAFRRRGVPLVATVPRGGADLREADLRGPVVIVLGAEGAGLPATLLLETDLQVTIPMRAGVESLNVSVAAALMVYEAARQRAAVVHA